MLVFGLDEIDFEYAYSFDGPYEPEKGIIFDKKKKAQNMSYAKYTACLKNAHAKEKLRRKGQF